MSTDHRQGFVIEGFSDSPAQ